MPIYGTYDAAFDEELKPYIDRLVAARGLIECPQAFRLAKKLKDECAEFARLSQDRVYENLSFRGNVIAYLKACVLYISNDYKWDKTIEDFIRWSLNYDLWCKMQFFGEAIEEAENLEEKKTRKRGPQNLMELLPDEFTLDDAKMVRQQRGKSNENDLCDKMIKNWLNREYIIQTGEQSYKKDPEFEFENSKKYGKRKRK